MRLNLDEVQARKALGYNCGRIRGEHYWAVAARRKVEVFPLYELPEPGVYPCTYCGFDVEVIIRVNRCGYVNAFRGMDHVPPMDFFVRNPEVVPDPRSMRCVPCCGECNCILGAMALDDLALKRRLILDRCEALLLELVPQVFTAPATSRKFAGEVRRLLDKISRLRGLLSSA